MLFLVFVALLLIPVAVEDFHRGIRPLDRIPSERFFNGPG